MARGDLDRARGEAEALRAMAATADEPRPRAEAARLLAEIALQGGHLSHAEVHLREARAAIEACDLPLVEWRIAATAARVTTGSAGAPTLRRPGCGPPPS